MDKELNPIIVAANLITGIARMYRVKLNVIEHDSWISVLFNHNGEDYGIIEIDNTTVGIYRPRSVFSPSIGARQTDFDCFVTFDLANPKSFGQIESWAIEFFSNVDVVKETDIKSASIYRIFRNANYSMHKIVIDGGCTHDWVRTRGCTLYVESGCVYVRMKAISDSGENLCNEFKLESSESITIGDGLYYSISAEQYSIVFKTSND